MNLDHLDLNLLRPLKVLLETRNVTRAAERLHLSQSATSAVLRRLRASFDDPLLVRQGRDFVLTPLAQSLEEPVASILASISKLTTDSGFDPPAASRQFTVMASDYAAHIIGRPLVSALARTAPNCRLELRDLSHDYRQVLRRDQVDVLLISSRLHHQDLADYPAAALFEDRFLLCGSTHNDAVRPGLDPADFESLPYVEYRPGGLVGLAEKGLEAAGVVPSVEIRTENQALIPELLRDTRLVAHVPSRLLVGHGGAGLRSVDPVVELPAIVQLATWHPSRAVDPGHEWFVRLLSTVINPSEPSP